MTTDQMRAVLLEYLRFNRDFPVVALEFQWNGTGHIADVMTIDQKGRLWEVEIKRSISDLRADQHKGNKHRILQQVYQGGEEELDKYHALWSALPARFYFAVPQDIKNRAGDAIRELYPYAGLMAVEYIGQPRTNGKHRWGEVSVKKSARPIHNKLLEKHLEWALVRGQSATLARMACRLAAAS